MDDERPYYELSMARSRKAMTRKLEGLQDTIHEHIMKLVVYRKYRPKDTNGWLRSLNKHLPVLQVFNKRDNGPNYTREQLIRKLDEYDDHIVKGFVELTFPEEGYPEIEYDPKYSRQCRQLMERYVDCILKRDRLTIYDLPQ